MTTLRKQFLLMFLLTALLTSFTGCGDGDSSSQKNNQNSFLVDKPETDPTEEAINEAKELLDDAALAIRKFERDPSKKSLERLMKVYNELQSVCDDEDLFKADRSVTQQADTMALAVKNLLENPALMLA